ncbi:MAG: NAD(P)-dependent oxidoreductase, partial [Microbacteriaceae bacterium]
MTTIGFIGLGNMGGRMTRRIVDAGIEVLGYDAKTDNIAPSGASAASSAAEVASSSDIVFLSLPESKIVEAVVRGADGIASHLREGTVVVDLSTSAPAATRSIHAELAERGVAYLDAGISGGAAAAEKGQLTLMVGGESEALA